MSDLGVASIKVTSQVSAPNKLISVAMCFGYLIMKVSYFLALCFLFGNRSAISKATIYLSKDDNHPIMVDYGDMVDFYNPGCDSPVARIWADKDNWNFKLIPNSE